MELMSLKSLYIDVKYNNINLGSATGFVVKYNDKNYLITNRHVVTGRNNESNHCMNNMGSIPDALRVVVPIVEENRAAWTSINIKLYDENDNPKWLEHPVYHGTIDVVAIEMLDFHFKSIDYSVVGNDEIEVTENVYIIGYPYGYSVLPGDKKVAVWTNGSVASEPEFGININGMQLPAFLVDAKTRSGQSGSPVIYYNNIGIKKEKGGVAMYGGPVSFNVGIYSGRINKDSDLGYVWKWSVIKEIIDSTHN